MAEVLSFPAQPPDAEARRQALDIHSSFIVEAPAGSGKTGLLIQRFLKLLADDSVTAPEQVLAITFTNKATAELRDRVLSHLESASRNSTLPDTTSEFVRQTRTLALAVLERDRQLGWALLEHPLRLNIRTIDSVCAEIARTLPVLSGSGGRLTPATDAAPLHREAARRTLLLLGNGDVTFDDALRDLLLHRDGNLAECELLIANMLSLRDQWGDLIPLTQPQLEDAYLDTKVLPRLELALDRAICAGLTQLAKIIPTDILDELTSLAADLGSANGYNNAPSPIALCAALRTSPQAAAPHLDHWLALIHLLITAEGSWRKEKGITWRNLKFEYDRKHHHHSRLTTILDQLSERDDLLLAFKRVRTLPPVRYPADQWAVARSLFRVLSRALVELQLVFAARGECDFTELSLLARHALAQDSGPEDLAAALGARLQHLLVDEMQDTSTSQYDLIQLLTASWDGHSQTVFLVGDPRQSIYLFRQARVERFIRAMEAQRLGDLPLARLRLTANFRSQQNLVDQFNEDFGLIFPVSIKRETDPHALPYTSAHSTLPASTHASGTVWHASPLSNLQSAGTPSSGTPAQTRQQQTIADANEILRIARTWLAKPLPPGRAEPWKIAVLVRSRNHLDQIAAALRQSAIPFRAVEIETLHDRQEILDLTALTRALLHPADRIATLAVLRAPWCSLTLADLYTLTGTDEPSLKTHSIARLMEERGHLLSEDSIQRLQRVWRVLTEATTQRARLTTAQLAERAWRSLGGEASLNPIQLTNARRFFQLLDTLEISGTRIDTVLLEGHLQHLYAEPDPIPPATPFVELLTIHKAKGLEWDVVFIPALERSAGRSSTRLLTWSEIESLSEPDQDAAHFMLAPIAGKGEESKALNNWLNSIHNAREAAERKRLFYVASTRAREELHLFASPQLNSAGGISPRPDSLLNAAWPAAQQHFLGDAAHAPDLVHKPLVLDIAATAPALALRPALHRLPLAFDPAVNFSAARDHKLSCGHPDNDPISTSTAFSRPEGSYAARSFGNAVHACLELLATHIAAGTQPATLLAELPAWKPRITAILRADGLPHTTINRLTSETLSALENILGDPDGLWLLASHADASNEFALNAWPDSGTNADQSIRPASIRVDRIFNAGPEPHAPDKGILWIVDYKTTNHGPTGLDDFLDVQRATYGSQLEIYARILAPAQFKSLDEVRLALYFPTIPRLIWWKPTSASD